MSQKMLRISSLALCLAGLVLCGCKERIRSGGGKVAEAISKSASNLASSLKGTSERLSKEPEESTTITTKPSKIYIEVNGEYMGRSPCVLRWKELLVKRPDLAEATSIVIKAYPMSPGLYTQVRIYDLENEEEKKLFPPLKIHFDMGLQPVGKAEEE